MPAGDAMRRNPAARQRFLRGAVSLLCAASAIFAPFAALAEECAPAAEEDDATSPAEPDAQAPAEATTKEPMSPVVALLLGLGVTALAFGLLILEARTPYSTPAPMAALMLPVGLVGGAFLLVGVILTPLLPHSGAEKNDEPGASGASVGLSISFP
jgi:hypothetical protein